jgi:hypothetical protein
VCGLTECKGGLVPQRHGGSGCSVWRRTKEGGAVRWQDLGAAAPCRAARDRGKQGVWFRGCYGLAQEER